MENGSPAYGSCRQAFSFRFHGMRGGIAIQPELLYPDSADRTPVRRALTVLLPALSAAAVLLLFPAYSADGVRAGLSLCAHAVIPALFPFTVLTPLLCRSSEALFRGRGRAQTAALTVSFAVGLLTGFPIGAMAVCDFYRDGILPREQAERAVGIAGGCGPAFLVGYLGRNLCGSAAVGWCFVLAQIIACLAAALLFFHGKGFYTEAPVPASARQSARQLAHSVPALTDAVREGIEKMFSVCGFVVFFSALRGLAAEGAAALGLPRAVIAFLCGLLEMTGGLSDLAAALPDAPALRLPLSAFLACSGGFCVFLQTAALVRGAGLSMRYYVRERLVCGLLCASLAAVFCCL